LLRPRRRRRRLRRCSLRRLEVRSQRLASGPSPPDRRTGTSRARLSRATSESQYVIPDAAPLPGQVRRRESAPSRATESIMVSGPCPSPGPAAIIGGSDPGRGPARPRPPAVGPGLSGNAGPGLGAASRGLPPGLRVSSESARRSRPAATTPSPRLRSVTDSDTLAGGPGRLMLDGPGLGCHVTVTARSGGPGKTQTGPGPHAENRRL
jgi:hypothetical protein